MTPRDVKAIRILAEYLGLDGVGYNPRNNDGQAGDLIKEFGLIVRFEKKQRGRWEGYVAYKDGEEIEAMGGCAEEDDQRRYVIVHAAAQLVKPGWDEHWNCFEDGLDPFKIGHIVDARSYDDAS